MLLAIIMIKIYIHVGSAKFWLCLHVCSSVRTCEHRGSFNVWRNDGQGGFNVVWRITVKEVCIDFFHYIWWSMYRGKISRVAKTFIFWTWWRHRMKKITVLGSRGYAKFKNFSLIWNFKYFKKLVIWFTS